MNLRSLTLCLSLLAMGHADAATPVKVSALPTTNNAAGADKLLLTTTDNRSVAISAQDLLVNQAWAHRPAWASSNVQWRLAVNKTLTNVVDSSGCAYYPSNHSIWTIHNNNNGRITEWTLDGVFLRKLDWTASQIGDGESITWLGGSQFAICDEDANRIIIFGITNNASGSTLDTNNTTIIAAHTSVGNDPGSGSGLEGIARDYERAGWWVVREKLPAQILFLSYDGQTTNNWFTTAQLQTFTNTTHTDYSDVFLDRRNQLLFVTQDEAGQADRVLCIDLVTSNKLFSLLCTNFGQLEGVSVTPEGDILLIGEANQFAIFTPELGGLNSGVSWEANSNTNHPSTPRFPFGLNIGDTTAWMTNILTATATLDFPSTTAQTSTNLTITLAGAASGDAVQLGVPTAAVTIHTCFTAWASNGFVYVSHNNYSAAARDPASGTFRAVVFKMR